MTESNLFDMSDVLMDSPRLIALKEADIQTHHAPFVTEAPWMAIPMKAAVAFISGYSPTDQEVSSIADLTASYGRLLDESGMVFNGKSKTEVEDMALEFVGTL